VLVPRLLHFNDDMLQVENSYITTKPLILYFDISISSRELHQKKLVLSSSESFRIKKVVVDVTQLITALISIHSSMTLLANMYSFLDPPSRIVLFSLDDRSLFLVNCMIGLIRVVGEC